MTTEKFAAPPLPNWLANQLPFDRYRLKIGGHAIHVMESGAGTPVLLLHGNPTWGFLYRKVALALRNRPFRLIMPDLLGLGLSDHPTDPSVHTLTNHAKIIAGLIHQLGLDGFVLAGQDWGGAIGLCAVADRLASVKGLLMMNTVVGPPKPGFRPTPFHKFARVPLVSDFAFRVLAFPQAYLALTQHDRSSIRGEVARAYRWPLRDRRTNAAPLELARMVPNDLEHPSIAALRVSEEAFRTFAGPIELVWGTGDPILGRVGSHHQRLRPDARMTSTPAGHFLQEEVPEEIAQAIGRLGQQLRAVS